MDSFNVLCMQKRLPLHIEYRLIYSLTKDIIDASIYDTSLFNYMLDIDVYKIEDEEVKEEEFVPCTCHDLKEILWVLNFYYICQMCYLQLGLRSSGFVHD